MYSDRGLYIKAGIYAIDKHSGCNHTYDGQNYAVHLLSVVHYAYKFKDLLPGMPEIRGYVELDNVLAACWLHDVIEDCRVTYNDLIVEGFSKETVEIVYALTNEKGRNRKERANDKYYEGIRNTPGAVFVKLCDRLANVCHSYQQKKAGMGILGRLMIDVYRDENPDFIEKLCSDSDRQRYGNMIDELEAMFKN